MGEKYHGKRGDKTESIIETLEIYGITGAIPFSLAVTALYVLIRVIYLKTTKRARARLSEEIARGMLMWYLSTLVVVVWLPYLPDFIHGKLTAGEFAERIFDRGEFTSNNRFLRLLSGDLSVLGDSELISNILLFIPYGALLAAAFRALKWWAADLILLGSTLVIELVQPALGRSCDADDIIANTLGGAVGCLAAKLVIKLTDRTADS